MHLRATADGKEPFDMTNGTERAAIESSQNSPAGESVRYSAGCQQWRRQAKVQRICRHPVD
jgi:hypothetical protein